MRLQRVHLASALVLVLCVSSCQIHSEELNDTDTRDKRFIHKTKKLGFFGSIATMGRLAYEQYADTTKTFRSILDILNDSFSDTATKPPPSATEASVTNETTTERYRISRAELGKILNRNFRGLQKLLKIELNDAFNQTKYTIADYKADYYKQVKKPRKTRNDLEP
ncbi:uncharacterized protein LOC134835537 [Culicoides brevitarsis]|uniref:uncharacterized protein LOC134835537 n=1 Tax=Culicoides brevitarsis TaxID=469753 RepID=UPI00307B7A5A